MRFASVVLLTVCAMLHYRCGGLASGMSGTMISGEGIAGEGMRPGWSPGELILLGQPFFEITWYQPPSWNAWRREQLDAADSVCRTDDGNYSPHLDMLQPEACLARTEPPGRSRRVGNASVRQLLPPFAAQIVPDMISRPADLDTQEARCDRILRAVIARGFPDLRGAKISLQFANFHDYWMYYEPAGAQSLVIGVDNSLRDAPRRVLEGGLAHELAHIERDARLSPPELDLAFALYRISESWRIREERQTDLEVIRRGYGRCLLALMVHAHARGYPPCPEHGLLPAEVRSLL